MYASHGTDDRLSDAFQGSLGSARNCISSEISKIGCHVHGCQQENVTYGLERGLRGKWMIAKALPEKLPSKIKIIGGLDSIIGAETIIVGNSSSYSTGLILQNVKRPHGVVNTQHCMPSDWEWH